MTENNFAGINFGYDSNKIFKERSSQMCNRWKHTQAKFSDCNVDVMSNSEGEFKVKGSSKYIGDNVS